MTISRMQQPRQLYGLGSLEKQEFVTGAPDIKLKGDLRMASADDDYGVMEEDTEENTMELMKDQGIPYGEQVSAPSRSSELNDLSMSVFGKSLEELTEIEVEMLMNLAREKAAYGGIMNSATGRRAYGLGSVFKSVGKAVKGVAKGVKKFAKSDLGKAALLAAGGYYLGGGNLFGLQRAGMSGFKFANLPGAGLFAKSTPVKLAAGVPDRLAFNAARTAAGTSSGGLGIGAAITAVSLLPLLGLGTGDESEEEAQAILDQSGLDIDAIRANPNKYLATAFKAEGGSIKEPVAKKTMPLLDMGGQEMDLRAEGGFVPIGRMEKADDVPARLSKNEFVFTAEAVRNAGEGDVDKGAEVMYNMMKNLEAGGDVSEESQGLEGARKMFQTSQRLEEVL